MKKVISTIISVVIMLCLSLTAFAESNCKRLLTMTFLFVIYTQIKYQVHCQSPTRLQLVNPLYVVFQVQLLKSL